MFIVKIKLLNLLPRKRTKIQHIPLAGVFAENSDVRQFGSAGKFSQKEVTPYDPKNSAFHNSDFSPTCDDPLTMRVTVSFRSAQSRPFPNIIQFALRQLLFNPQSINGLQFRRHFFREAENPKQTQ